MTCGEAGKLGSGRCADESALSLPPAWWPVGTPAAARLPAPLPGAVLSEYAGFNCIAFSGRLAAVVDREVVLAMAVNETGVVQVRTPGIVPTGMPELARSKVEALLRHVGEPVLFARVMLSSAADPAVERPAIAWAIVSVNGRVVRASGVGSTMGEAIAQLVSRLRIRLERAWPDQRERGRRSTLSRRLRQLS
jgi:hypothetical protein